MKKRWTWLLTAVLTMSLALPSGVIASADSAQTAPAAEKGLANIASKKAELMTREYGVTSVQYALIDNGVITLSGQSGVNDVEAGTPLTKDTMYGVGSVSKMFTAAAVMKLVDEGKINLDAPLTGYIPDFTMKDERYKQITPRMLLNHSSGLMGSSLRNSFLFNDNDRFAHDELLPQLADQRLKAEPGAFSVYSNDSFTLAEILVERVSGMDFTAFIHQHFTGPLSMKHTKTSQEKLDPAKLAATYDPMQGKLPVETINVIGAGGIYSTAEDLARFSTIFTGGKEDLISDQSVQATMQQEYRKGLWPKDADNSFDYGLGWDSVRQFPFNNYGITALSKGGDTILYHASLVVLPDHNMAAAVLSSGGSGSFNQLLASDLLLQSLKSKGEIGKIKPDQSFGKPVQSKVPERVKQHAGYYSASGQLIKATIQSSGKLVLSCPVQPGCPDQEYIYTADGSFVNEEGTSKVDFVKETNGRTYIWNREYAGVPGLGQMALSHYAAEKLTGQKLPAATAAAWKKREGKKFYLVNEKYTSLMYMIMHPSFDISRPADWGGYVFDKKITGPDSADSIIQIPGMNGRDTFDLELFKSGGTEYAKAAGSLYLSEKAVKPLYSGKSSRITIKADGYARWVTIPRQAAGKTMTVSMPAEGAFAVYNENGQCVNFTVISGNNKIKLPENGTVVFAGPAGVSFGIALK